MEFDSAALNLRHLHAFREVCKAGGISHAAASIHLSQPAVTQAIANLERQLRAKLFTREARGMTPTGIGEGFHFRVDRALHQLNAKISRSRRGPGAIALPVESRATTAQLRALIAVSETGAYSAAARTLGVAQPTVHRACRDLKAGLGLELLIKSGTGVQPTHTGRRLAQNARLAFSELDQALQEIRTTLGRNAGVLRIGALPLARATVLSRAIDHLAVQGVPLRFNIDDGPYPDLLHALRIGGLDILIGALRTPAPATDVVEEHLFDDRLGIFCGPNHPLRHRSKLDVAELSAFPWVVPRKGTPTRKFFDRALGRADNADGGPLIETSSMVLIRELLQSRDRLTLISRAQVATEVRTGMLCELRVPLDDTPRPIGVTRRAGWYPTTEQDAFLSALISVSKPFKTQDVFE